MDKFEESANARRNTPALISSGFAGFRAPGGRIVGRPVFLCIAACDFKKFPTFSTWFSTQKALFLHEKGFVCGKLPRCILLHINFSTYGPTVDFQAPFKEKLWKT